MYTKLTLVHILGLCCCIAVVSAEADDDQLPKSRPTNTTAVATEEHPVFREPDPKNLVIDGDVSEPVWARALALTDFRVNNRDPDRLTPASEPTTARVFYNDRGLYLAAVMAQTPGTVVRRISEQDPNDLQRDFVTLMLDPSGDGTSGFYFTLFRGGNRLDGTLKPERNFDHTWDGAWSGAVLESHDQWSAEFFIPWSILHMRGNAEERTMGLLIERHVAHLSEKSSWPVIHFTSPRFLSAFSRIRVADVSPRQQLDFFPYIATENNLFFDERETRYGADVFWRPMTNFQLTAATRPDFGTVEADAVILNFSAFETFFPEKRLFFQEGMEVFSVGTGSIVPLHTRRIGASPIVTDLPSDVEFDYRQFSRPTELHATAKATGQVGDLRFGFLGAWEDDSRVTGQGTDDAVELSLHGRDFEVGRVLYEDRSRGLVSVGGLVTRFTHPSVRAMTQTVDLKRHSRDGTLKVSGLLVHSDATDQDDGYGGHVQINYSPSPTRGHWFLMTALDDSINLNHTGFLSRNDTRGGEYTFDTFQFSDDGPVRESGTRFWVAGYWNGQDERITSWLEVSKFYLFQKLDSVAFGVVVAPPTVDDRNAYGDGSFRTLRARTGFINYFSDNSKPMYYGASLNVSDGDRSGLSCGVNGSLTWRPYDRLRLSGRMGYSRSDSWLLYQSAGRFTEFSTESLSTGSSVAFYINAKQHVRFDLDWSAFNALEKSHLSFDGSGPALTRVSKPDLDGSDDFSGSWMNLQLRYRWEIAPLSDVFVVYTTSASLPDALGSSFYDMFTETLDHPTSEFLVAKIRYRFSRS